MAHATATLNRHLLRREHPVRHQSIHDSQDIFLRQKAQLDNFFLLHEALLAQDAQYAAKMGAALAPTERPLHYFVEKADLDLLEAALPVDGVAVHLQLLVEARLAN